MLNSFHLLTTEESSVMEQTNVQTTSSLKIDTLSVKKAALIVRSINHKLRQQIIKLLDEHGKLTVTEIYVKLRLEQSVASQHLAILRKAGFVDTIRDGKNIHYSVNISKVNHLQNMIQLLFTEDENN
jgi:DNA-binding transcriptional ArsR family regulator